MRVVKIVYQHLLNQYGGIPGIFTFNHYYILKPINSDTTKAIIHEDFRGIGVNFWNDKWLEQAYSNLIISLENHINVLNNKL